MIIKLKRIISCSSEHPSYSASNLLEYQPSSNHLSKCWKCAKPGEMLTTVIFEMDESSCITGLNVGNYRSCVVIVEASTASEPDNWLPIVNHQFMTNDEAANNKFRDQVQIFTKKELNPDTLKTKFDRIKVTCMQPANPRELFGLAFVVFKTEVVVDLNIDIFGRFKMKETEENSNSKVEKFKEKYSKLFTVDKKNSYKEQIKAKAKEESLEKFSKRQEEERDPPKRPMLQKLEEGKADEVFGLKPEKKENNTKKVDNQNVKYTPFGDFIASTSTKTDSKKVSNEKVKNAKLNGKHSLDSEDSKVTKKLKCKQCNDCAKDKLCSNCGLLYAEKESKNDAETMKEKKKTKEFSKLFEGISFSLSGYVNPQRDSIRRKALEMGAKYIADPNSRNGICTHLVCAFKNTPKYQQLKNQCKVVSHKFIEDCFEKKTRFPWRRYALDKQDKTVSESEEEIEAIPSDPYDMDTDESDY